MSKGIYILFLSILLFQISCEKEIHIKGFEKYKIDKNIIHNSIFKTLNNQTEFDFGYRFRKIKKNQKRSNNIEIETELGGIKNNFREFNSEAYFYTHFENQPTDTIFILIDNFNGYYGNGITLKIFKDFFKTEYSEQGDVIINNKTKDSVKIFESKLTLNNKNFKINDSIYGFLQLKMEKNNELIYAKGFFRTKITQRKF